MGSSGVYSCIFGCDGLTDFVPNLILSIFLVLDPVVCVVCAKLARNDVEDITNSDYYHWVNFLFVKGDYQVRTLGCNCKK